LCVYIMQCISQRAALSMVWRAQGCAY
jgi:hypothetical protein